MVALRNCGMHQGAIPPTEARNEPCKKEQVAELPQYPNRVILQFSVERHESREQMECHSSCLNTGSFEPAQFLKPSKLATLLGRQEPMPENRVQGFRFVAR